MKLSQGTSWVLRICSVDSSVPSSYRGFLAILTQINNYRSSSLSEQTEPRPLFTESAMHAISQLCGDKPKAVPYDLDLGTNDVVINKTHATAQSIADQPQVKSVNFCSEFCSPSNHRAHEQD